MAGTEVLLDKYKKNKKIQIKLAAEKSNVRLFL